MYVSERSLLKFSTIKSNVVFWKRVKFTPKISQINYVQFIYTEKFFLL
ncbi:hypothetical protein HMPREF1705_04732 [Acetomicrobium hydrogeniformans ATCC BAA-1850]|uniref:Uncharacterized protein n=1 Tax=Acetomicrobium hydrogeniformans ATCC BAA-1850 TaxID=592015 RepID=A0A0T5X8S7_9BACT|nr:hypothetical protein HMPREF1705_04732 [Acetomicrobium hydrogeniformans ATCC BAA-1850]